MSENEHKSKKKKLLRWLVYYPLLGVGAIVTFVFFMITFPLFVLTTAISASITTTRLSVSYLRNKFRTHDELKTVESDKSS